MHRRLFLRIGTLALVGFTLVGLAQVALTWFVAGVVALGSLSVVWIGWSFSRSIGPRRDQIRAENLARFRDADPPDGEITATKMHSVEADAFSEIPFWLRFRAEIPDDSIPPAILEARNPPLLGRVTVVSIFLGRHGSSWSENDIAYAIEALFSAGTWIEQEAQRWSARVNIDLSQVLFVHDETVEEDVEVVMALEANSRGLWDRNTGVKHLGAVSRAARAWGYADAADLLSRINPRLNSDAVVWVVHHRCAGRSIAIPAAWAELPGVGIAVLYSRYANLPEPLGKDEEPWSDPLTLAHELFHLFGATDKYGRPTSKFPTGTVTNRDIMRLGARTLTQHEVGPLTAYEVGWVIEPVLQPDSKQKSPGVSRRKRGRAF